MTAQEIATGLSDEALADLLHDLGDILHARLRDRPREGSGFKRQIDAARIEVRSWPSSRQATIRMDGEIAPQHRRRT